VVYDLIGKESCVLVSAYRLPGTYHVFWDGTDMNGKQLENGVYFYKLLLPDGNSMTKKMLLVR